MYDFLLLNLGIVSDDSFCLTWDEPVQECLINEMSLCAFFAFALGWNSVTN